MGRCSTQKAALTSSGGSAVGCRAPLSAQWGDPHYPAKIIIIIIKCVDVLSGCPGDLHDYKQLAENIPGVKLFN